MPVAPADLERAGLRLDIETREPADGAAAPAAVATVTLDRPRRRNAMTPGMWRGLAGVGRALPPEVRIVVITGAGPTFSAGIDLRLLSAEGVPGEEPLPDPRSAGFEAWIADCQAGFSWLRGPGSSRSRLYAGTRSAPDSSSPSRATCGCSAMTRRSA